MLVCTGYAATAAGVPLAPFSFHRRDPGPTDIEIEILYCGVCHSDIHQARSEWAGTLYPCVPGHEIVGVVTRVGEEVTSFHAGHMAGVGCLVDSCRNCANCGEGLEQYCENGWTGTYNSPDPHTGGHTFGGYSSHIVVDQAFVLRIPDALDPAAAAPLLCAGITTYSPLRHWKAGPGKKVGIVGLGGLGHMGVKLAHAMGAHVVLFTTSMEKWEDALRLGADEVVLSKDPAQMAAHAASFDFILNTVAAKIEIDPYLALLARDGTLTQVGAPAEPQPVSVFSLIMKRRNYAGSLIGGLRETQEMLDFCAKHGLASDIEMIKMDQINEAFDRVVKGDVKYRFVVDMKAV